MSGHRGRVRPQTVAALLDGLDRQLRGGTATFLDRVPTGFDAFDDAIGGGLRRGDLAVFAGPPGVGKSILGLQLARHAAGHDHPALFVCYEHDQTTLLLRLLAQEAAGRDGKGKAASLLASRLQRGARKREGLADVVRGAPVLDGALRDLSSIGRDLVLLAGSIRDTDLPALDEIVAGVVAGSQHVPVLVVDYLQQVPSDDVDPSARARHVVEGLKDLAMHHQIPVVALASINVVGLTARRLRMAHLGESSAIAFEADVVVLLSNKADAAAKAHVAYGGTAARGFDDWVVWTVEKNRSGPNLINLEFEKDFAHFRYQPQGRLVAERLADDRLLGDGS